MRFRNGLRNMQEKLKKYFPVMAKNLNYQSEIFISFSSYEQPIWTTKFCLLTFWGDFLKGKSCQNTPKNANITFYIRYIKELGTYLLKLVKFKFVYFGCSYELMWTRCLFWKLKSIFKNWFLGKLFGFKYFNILAKMLPWKKRFVN
mgnify:CR=1 FL=1